MKPVPAISPVTNSLWSRAAAEDSTVLADPRVAFLRDPNEDTPLHILASTGNKDVLTHPKVATVANKFGLTPLHVLASLGVQGVVEHPQVAEVVDKRGETPLHYLAYAGCIEALRHPDVGFVVDETGRTPLMELAEQGNEVAEAMLVEQKPVSDELYDDVPCLSPVATLVADEVAANIDHRKNFRSTQLKDLSILSEMDDLDSEFNEKRSVG